MRGTPIIAVAATAAIVVALTGVVSRAVADAPQTADVVATAPLSVPAAYHPTHYLADPTKGAGGVTLVKPAQAVVLHQARTASAAFTGDAMTSSAAHSATKQKAHASKKTDSNKKHAKKKHAKKAHPKKAHTKKAHTKKSKSHSKKSAHHSKPHETFLEWLLKHLKHHHHHG